ncbi:disulfide bond formation protein DsbA [Longispora sp. K20-0274]|uniref:mycothiol-dependent nitroreductase Rv2466c family protein n=1 Tax=Longispora sp. K20-0274 TaxID=3088255 RepID=UPI00399C36D6
MADGRTTVDLWVDPICPWAWRAARWLLEVERVRGVTVRFRLMSLSVLNQGRENLDMRYRLLLNRGWGPARVCAVAEAKDALRPLYLAMAGRIHENRAGLGDPMLRAALTAADLPADWAASATDDTLDEVLRAAHDQVTALVGDELGTPVIHVAGLPAFFGPVVVEAPTGDAAGRLWDGALLVAGTPGFFEIKRSREAGTR